MTKNIDFTVDYSKLNLIDEFNTDELNFPLILSVPHSGTVFPEEFLSHVKPDMMTLRRNEDIFVKDLLETSACEFAFVPPFTVLVRVNVPVLRVLIMVSSASVGITSGSTPCLFIISSRLGDAEASITFLSTIVYTALPSS